MSNKWGALQFGGGLFSSKVFAVVDFTRTADFLSNVERESGLKKRPGTRFIVKTLIICLCLGSLVILPMSTGVGLSLSDVYESGIENTIQLEQSEYDEDLSSDSFSSPINAGLVFLKSGLARLRCTSSFLLLDSPPPKSS
jgi:hypothetical protein